MKLLIYCSILTILISTHSSGQTLMLSAKPLEKNSICIFSSFQFSKTTKKYNWGTNDWDILPDSSQTKNAMILPMLGYGITDKLSLYAQLPLYEKVVNESYNYYSGEIVLMTRYALIPASSKKTGLLLQGAIRFPAGIKYENPYADESFDIILGEIFSTRWYGKFRTHLKSEFCINTINKKNINPGEQFTLLLKQDFKIQKFILYITNQYVSTSKMKNENDEVVENSNATRFLHLLGLDYSLKQNLTFKSKIQIPSYCQGGSLFNQKFIFELVYYIKPKEKTI